ncbi:MAG: hypothetical protein ACREOU_07795 [Candidatus Eiseniibacteriota bacterium]
MTAGHVRSWLLTDQTVNWTLRVGAFLCFVGHGAFGVMTKDAWVPYFGVVGIGSEAAFAWMPIVGAWDILVGCLVLVAPRPAITLWMVGWATWTALLRPLAGEPVWEALERAGNYGVPMALFLRMSPWTSWRALFAPATFLEPTPDSCRRVRAILTITIVLLLVGHGALSIQGKPQFVFNLASVAGARTPGLLLMLGWLELALAAAVALRPTSALLLVVAAWKMGTEFLFVTAGAPVWEWIERAGGYAAPLALAIVMTQKEWRTRPQAALAPQPEVTWRL